MRRFSPEVRLAAAVYAGDIDAARAALDDMARTTWSAACMLGRRLAHPPAPLPDTAPMPLPIPDHLRETVLGPPLRQINSRRK